MDSIENGATIRIGFKEYNDTLKVPTYSLKIDKKSVLIASGGGSSKNYIEIYKKAAEEIAQIMRNQQVEEYVIYNGERVRISNKQWESCWNIPKDGEEIFRKTLSNCLNWIQ